MTDTYFHDKVVWITGASSGIGEAMAHRLDKAGARLILSGRNEEALNRVRKSCSSPCAVLAFDLADYHGMEGHAREALEVFGRIDVLVNNGGQGCRSLAAETDITVDERIMQINYLGNIALAKAVLPHFLERGGGQFIVVSSLAGKFGTKSRSAYAASKHALHGFYESLLAETYNDGVRVTLACPGFVDTQLLERSWDGSGRMVPSVNRVNKRMTAWACAGQILQAAAAGKEEVIIGETFKERVSVDIKRFFPAFFSNMMKKANVS